MLVSAIFFTDDNYRYRESSLVESLRELAFDTVTAYRREQIIETDLYKENKEIMDLKRGSGYWLWKPYIILDALSKTEEGDVVFYMDAGDNIHKRNFISELKEYMKNNNTLLTIALGDKNKYWTKRDCFMLMDCDYERYHECKQLETGTLAFKNNPSSINLLHVWHEWCKCVRVVNDSKSVYGEDYEGFVEHRHDQSILTNLAISMGLEPTTHFSNMITYNQYLPR